MENSYSIEQLIEQLEDLLADATKVPFNKRSMVDTDKMNEVVEDMRMTLPMEIQQAQKVVLDKNNIINAAKQEAESIIRQAEQQRAQMLDENEIVREARRRATDMLSAEQNRCADIRSSTNDYVENMLKRVAELMTNNIALMSSNINDLNTLRANINGVQNAPQQQQQSTVRPMEKPGE